MKSSRNLIASILQLTVGILAIGAFFILGLNGENMTKWIITLILAVCFAVMGAVGIIAYVKNK